MNFAEDSQEQVRFAENYIMDLTTGKYSDHMTVVDFTDGSIRYFVLDCGPTLDGLEPLKLEPDVGGRRGRGCAIGGCRCDLIIM